MPTLLLGGRWKRHVHSPAVVLLRVYSANVLGHTAFCGGQSLLVGYMKQKKYSAMLVMLDLLLSTVS